MDLKTHRTVRGLYYGGILILILNVFPLSKGYLDIFLGKEIVGDMTILMLIALFTAVGALMAFNRKW